MAKLAIFIILFSCATANKKLGVKLTVSMRDNLYDTQNRYEEFKNIDDQFFKSLEGDKCLLNWESEVFKAKEALKRATSQKQRVEYWFKLGNCYNYVGEYQLSFYYYDLVLGEEKKNLRRQSLIAYNMGRIYANRGHILLAESYFSQAVSLDKNNNQAQLELAIRRINQGEFKASFSNLNSLSGSLPQSRLVKFLKGVSYFHLSDYNSVNNKVLPSLDDKSIEKSLLKAAVSLANGKMTKEVFEEFAERDFEFSIHSAFQKYLVERYGESFNAKVEV